MVVQRAADISISQYRERIKQKSTSHFRHSLIMAAHCAEIEAMKCADLRRVWLKLQSAAELMFGGGKLPVVVEMDHRQDVMCQAQRLIHFERRLSFGPRLRNHIVG